MLMKDMKKFVNTIKTLRETIPDEVALQNISIYPEWREGLILSIGDRVKYNDKLYKVAQAHTSQADWVPNAVPALFTVLNITNKGSKEDPIVAEAGMIYYKDKYYLDQTNGKIYLCTRQDTDDGTVLHYVPSLLENIYFSVVK